MVKYYYLLRYYTRDFDIKTVVKTDTLLNEEERGETLKNWKEKAIGIPCPEGGSIFLIPNLADLYYYDQCTLLNLIQYVQSLPDNAVFKRRLDNPHSARHDYMNLAFELVEKEITKERQLEIFDMANGNTYEGYKGGDFLMNEGSQVYLAEEGVCGTPICKEFLSLFFSQELI